MERAETVQLDLLIYTDLDCIYCQCARALIFPFESLFHYIYYYVILGLYEN